MPARQLLFAYGSLLREAMGADKVAPALLRGWTRTWDAVRDTRTVFSSLRIVHRDTLELVPACSLLSLSLEPAGEVHGAVFEVSETRMRAFDLAEYGYTKVSVTDQLEWDPAACGMDPDAPVLAYVSTDAWGCPGAVPAGYFNALLEGVTGLDQRIPGFYKLVRNEIPLPCGPVLDLQFFRLLEEGKSLWLLNDQNHISARLLELPIALTAGTSGAPSYRASVSCQTEALALYELTKNPSALNIRDPKSELFARAQRLAKSCWLQKMERMTQHPEAAEGFCTDPDPWVRELAKSLQEARRRGVLPASA